MTSRWGWVAALLATALTTGCSSVIGGHAVPAPVPPIMQVMVDGAALAKLLAQPFKTTPLFPPSYGGREKFGTAWEDARPSDCIGVAFMMQKIVYQSVPVQEVADVTWKNDGHSVKVDNVDEGVISFPSSKDAAAAFAKFSAQWKGCDGTTLIAQSVTSAGSVISNVHLTDSVVAASLLVHPHEHSILASTPVARALGVRGCYLVEVAVRFFGNDDPSAQGAGDLHTSAVDIAHAMMDRLTLS
jgi:PknH-like extracellular domain